jgi:hypothetical protein
LLRQKTLGKKSIAQGTIEYLVIIAIVVISLVVVALLLGFLDSGSDVASGSGKIAGFLFWTFKIRELFIKKN